MPGGYNNSGHGYQRPQPTEYSPYGDNITTPARPTPRGGFPPFPPSNRTTYGQGTAGQRPQPNFNPTYDEYNPSTPAARPMASMASDPNLALDLSRKRNFDQAAYDPSQPAAYDPGAPHIRAPPAHSQSVHHDRSSSYQVAVTNPSQRNGSGYHNALALVNPAAGATHTPAPGVAPTAGKKELHLLTPVRRVSIGQDSVRIHELPSSQLPILKYIAINDDEALDVHRAVCKTASSPCIWYCDGCVKAGEGWVSAIEWSIEASMSKAKLRGLAGKVDPLGVEYRAIIKAVEGFLTQIQSAYKSNTNPYHELVLVVSSAAAIVGIDTSSRPECAHFRRLWGDICDKFIKAQLTFIWIPSDSTICGLELARKIATVGAQNSYRSRSKKDKIFNNDRALGASVNPGPWQYGDADPTFPKSPYQRAPLQVTYGVPSVQQSPTPAVHNATGESPSRTLRYESLFDMGEVHPPPRSLCVSNFPDAVVAKDLGLIFQRYGNIHAVDIFSIPELKPRLAFVSFADPEASNRLAVDGLHGRLIDLDEGVDKDAWKDWTGPLMVAESTDGNLPVNLTANLPALLLDRPAIDIEIQTKKHGLDKTATPRNTTPSNKKARLSASEESPDQTLPESSNSNGQVAGDLGLNSGPAYHEPDCIAHQAPASSTTTAQSSITEESSGNDISHTTETNSASELQKTPNSLSVQIKTLRKMVLVAEDGISDSEPENWIAHSCMIAGDVDQVRQEVQTDYYATAENIRKGKVLEKSLTEKGYTTARIETFVTQVLKTLDTMAMADEERQKDDTPMEVSAEEVEALQARLAEEIKLYPEQTRVAMAAAIPLVECLYNSKEAQAKLKVEAERRVLVLEAMNQMGDQVMLVVKYLLNQ